VDATFGLVRITVLYGPAHTDEAERAAQRGRALAQEIGNVETLAGLYTFHGLALTGDDRERFGQGLALVEEGLVLAQRAGLELAATSISRGLAWIYAIDGQLALARRTIDWVVQDLEVRGQRAKATEVFFGARLVRESILYVCDDLAATAESARETYELALAAPNRTAQSGSAATLAQVYFEQAEYAEAKRWADRSLEIAQSIGSLAGMRTASAVALASRIELGEPANVAAHLDAIEEGLAQGGTLPLNSRLVIEALLVAGEVERAKRVTELTYGRGGGQIGRAHV
jgi:hypothetical protein